MKSIANCPYLNCRKRIFSSVFSSLVVASLLSACALPDKPVQPTIYDFGPGALVSTMVPHTNTRVLMLADVEASPALDNSAMLYRLSYADEQQLQPYALARWSMPPAQLVRQRLRERLGQTGMVLSASEGATLGRAEAGWPLLLRLELEEFSQRFDTPQSSTGFIKLRAVLIETSAGTEKLIGQRVLTAQYPATSADAAGGVRAMAAATDTLAGELGQWLKAWR